MRFLIASATVLIIAFPCLSYELAQFNFIGFTEDGRYLAWEVYGIQDSSGYPYCRIEVMDVDNNSMISSEEAVFEYGDPDIETGQEIRTFFNEYLDDRENEYRYWESRARDIARNSIQHVLDSLEIVIGNDGVLCVHHPMTDRTNYPSGVQFVSGWEGPWYKASPLFEIRMQQSEIEGSDVSGGFADVLLNIELVNMDNDVITLLHDEIGGLDENEAAFSYGIRSVYLYRDTFIAIVLYRYQHGFEGPDVRYRVITGRLPLYEPTFWFSTRG